MRPRHHLVLALNPWGHGETSLGIRLASSLRTGGEGVVFVTTNANAPLVQRAGFRAIVLPRQAYPLLPLYIADCISKMNVGSIILSDHFTTASFLKRTGLDEQTLARFQLPVIAIDTWDSTRGQPIDVQNHGSEAPIDVLPASIIHPVPFLSPRASGAYQSLPDVPPKVARKVRKNVRRSLGISDSSQAVLFCSAAWQQGEHPLRGRWWLADSVPALLGEYLSRIDSAHVVHVGPKTLPMGEKLGPRYHWLPQLPGTDFRALMGSVDLFLSVNISAATIAEAMVAGVPVAVIQNSIPIYKQEDCEEALRGRTLSDTLRQWIHASIPICSFSLWPVGFYKFLVPVMQDNPYTRALELLELFDEEGIEQRIRRLLTDRAAREEHVQRQQVYLDEVRALHDGCEAVRQLCA